MVDKFEQISRIMTAIATARCKAIAKCSAKFCELTDAKFGVGDNF